MGEFLTSSNTKAVYYVKLMGEFSLTIYAVKVYDKVMGEFSSTMYTVKVLLCSSHGWIFTHCIHGVTVSNPHKVRVNFYPWCSGRKFYSNIWQKFLIKIHPILLQYCVLQISGKLWTHTQTSFALSEFHAVMNQWLKCLLAVQWLLPFSLCNCAICNWMWTVFFCIYDNGVEGIGNQYAKLLAKAPLSFRWLVYSTTTKSVSGPTAKQVQLAVNVLWMHG